VVFLRYLVLAQLVGKVSVLNSKEDEIRAISQ